MELKHIKELMAAMGRTGTKRLVIKKEDFEIELEHEDISHAKSPGVLEFIEDNPLKQEASARRANIALSRGAEMPLTLPAASAAQKEDETQVHITSPMVGTFYSAPSPDDPHFVKVGDKVDKNSVVCIIEAMKVMNEVKAGVNGTIAEVLVESGHPVEFGTKLFRIS